MSSTEHPAPSLSSCTVAAETGIVRDCPRPVDQRDARFHDQFDWDTLFYDVYRVGRHVVFQGPPFFNFLPSLQAAPLLAGAFGGFRPKARHVDRKRRGSEIWLRDGDESVWLEGPLGRFDIVVQPNLSGLFEGRRVLHTLSKDNDIAWIRDWIAFHVRIHGADAVLLYDNGSTAYTVDTLQGELRTAFPTLRIMVVDWPFKYGPQGGLAGAVNGREAPWDSDYCQTGSLQHARLRFLQTARSVLNVDIDELVLGRDDGRSIFEATERSWRKFVKFPGTWITATRQHPIDPDRRRHGDFWLRDLDDPATCPPKWCIVPDRKHLHDHIWSAHNLFGSRRNRRVSTEFRYRHIKAISNSWKENRADVAPYDASRFEEDAELKRALIQSGLAAAERR